VRTAEGPGEVARILISDATPDLFNGMIFAPQKSPCLSHPPLCNPRLHRLSRPSPYHGCHVPGAEIDGLRHVAKRDPLAKVIVDELEHVRKQRLTVPSK
jgi:hypothetical protein